MKYEKKTNVAASRTASASSATQAAYVFQLDGHARMRTRGWKLERAYTRRHAHVYKLVEGFTSVRTRAGAPGIRLAVDGKFAGASRERRAFGAFSPLPSLPCSHILQGSRDRSRPPPPAAATWYTGVWLISSRVVWSRAGGRPRGQGQSGGRLANWGPARTPSAARRPKSHVRSCVVCAWMTASLPWSRARGVFGPVWLCSRVRACPAGSLRAKTLATAARDLVLAAACAASIGTC
jgi:hypothetical protein